MSRKGKKTFIPAAESDCKQSVTISQKKKTLRGFLERLRVKTRKRGEKLSS